MLIKNLLALLLIPIVIASCNLESKKEVEPKKTLPECEFCGAFDQDIRPCPPYCPLG